MNLKLSGFSNFITPPSVYIEKSLYIKNIHLIKKSWFSSKYRQNVMIIVENTVWNGKKRNFENWDQDLRIARIDPDCGGVIIKIYGKLWELRRNSFLRKEFKKLENLKNPVFYRK